MLQNLSDWLWQEWLADAVVEYSFLQPCFEVLHFTGLALLVGIVGMLDLRLLGLGKGVPIAAIHRLLPWGIFGFGLTLVTGVLFIVGDPFKEPLVFFLNLSFRLKMLFVVLAGINALSFYVTGIAKRTDALGPHDDAPMGAKFIAATSILLWIGVMYFGRMLPWADALYLLFGEPDTFG